MNRTHVHAAKLLTLEGYMVFLSEGFQQDTAVAVRGLVAPEGIAGFSAPSRPSPSSPFPSPILPFPFFPSL